MTDRHRALLALHGGTLVLIALVLGLLAVTDAPVADARNWRSAHQTVLLFGAWLLATAGAAPTLRLEGREASGLVWALAVGGYSMTGTLVVRASTGVTGFEPGGSTANSVAFVSNAVVMLSSVLAGLLTISGAWNALRAGPESRAG
jgi:hypothetical protein